MRREVLCSTGAIMGGGEGRGGEIRGEETYPQGTNETKNTQNIRKVQIPPKVPRQVEGIVRQLVEQHAAQDVAR